jgi:hypothetical protein
MNTTLGVDFWAITGAAAHLRPEIAQAESGLVSWCFLLLLVVSDSLLGVRQPIRGYFTNSFSSQLDPNRAAGSAV